MARMDKVTAAGLVTIVTITVVTSYTTLAELAMFAGWDNNLAWLFPAALDVLALVACRIWLSPNFSAPSRSYAKWVTIGASALSIAGNGVGHLASTGHIKTSLWLVVAVGCVAPASLTVGIHLASLATNPVPSRTTRRKTLEPAPKQHAAEDRIVPGAAKPKTEKPKPKEKPHASRDLLAEARKADREHRAATGQPISRNRLRSALTIGQGTATDLMEQLKSEEEVA